MSNKRTIFIFIPSPQNYLVSPGLWGILGTWSSVFRPLHSYRVFSQKRKIHIEQCSPLKSKFLKVPFLLTTSLSFTTFLLLFYTLYFHRAEVEYSQVDMVRTLVMFYVTLILPVILPSSFVIAFRPDSMCQTLNQIDGFYRRIIGNYFING